VKLLKHNIIVMAFGQVKIKIEDIPVTGCGGP
jgi:hypothetical protein